MTNEQILFNMINKNKLDRMFSDSYEEGWRDFFRSESERIRLKLIESLVERLIELDKFKQPFVSVDASTGETTVIRRYRSEVKELAEYEESYIKEQIRNLLV